MDPRPAHLIRPPPYDAPQPVTCYNVCQFFKCSQNALYFKGNVAWCRLADDACENICPTCKFASCIRNKLLPSGTCGFSVKVKELEFRPDPSLKPVKIPSKLARKLKEDELF